MTDELDDEEQDAPKRPLEGVVRRAHAVEPGSVVLVLERYAGDVEVGDAIELAHPSGARRAHITNVAWGSSFGYEAPPLTLVVTGIALDEGYAGATLRSVDRDA